MEKFKHHRFRVHTGNPRVMDCFVTSRLAATAIAARRTGFYRGPVPRARAGIAAEAKLTSTQLPTTLNPMFLKPHAAGRTLARHVDINGRPAYLIPLVALFSLRDDPDNIATLVPCPDAAPLCAISWSIGRLPEQQYHRAGAILSSCMAMYNRFYRIFDVPIIVLETACAR